MPAPRPTCRSSCTRTGDASGMVRRTNGPKAPVSSSSPRTCLTGGTTPARASSAAAAVLVRKGSQESPLGAQRGDQSPRAIQLPLRGRVLGDVRQPRAVQGIDIELASDQVLLGDGVDQVLPASAPVDALQV